MSARTVAAGSRPGRFGRPASGDPGSRSADGRHPISAVTSRTPMTTSTASASACATPRRNAADRNAAMQIDIIVFDGVDELDALGPLEVFRSAAALGADLTARLVTRHPTEQVRGAYGLRFAPDAVYRAGVARILLVPGGGWVARKPLGVWGEYQRGEWLPLLAAAASNTAVLAGICTGTMLLAHAGVIGTRRAATHHAARADLAATGATVVLDRVVDDGNLITSGGVTSGIDLALRLVARESSSEIATQVARRLEYPSVLSGWNSWAAPSARSRTSPRSST